MDNDRDWNKHYADWCERKVRSEQTLEASGCLLDVWPAGWTLEQRERARAVGIARIAAEEKS